MNAALAALGKWNIDGARHALERMNPALYLNSSYYLRWLYRTEVILVEHEMVSRGEIETPPEQRQVKKQAEPLRHAEIVSRARSAKSARVDVNVAARFSAGETVRARNIHPTGHTRLPRYVRGRTGMVDKDYGVFVFPDTRAVFAGDKPQHLYSVCFTARELWGDDASARDKVYLDIWDDYLELG